MATIIKLVADEALIEIDGGLDEDQLPNRYLYALPDVYKKLESLRGEDVEFDEDLFGLFNPYCSGELMFVTHRVPGFRYIERSQDIWELKSPIFRLFGWFCAKNTFVITHILQKRHLLQDGNIVNKVAAASAQKRNQLDLDPPKFIAGRHPDDKISNYR